EGGARPDLDTLDLEAGPFLQHRIRAPWPGDGAVRSVGVVAASLELTDDFAHALQVIAVRDQQRVWRVDDDQVVDTDGSDDAVAGVDEGVARADSDALALAAIARCVGFGQRRDRLPRTDVAPVESAADYGDAIGLFHHCVVDRNVRHGGEQRGFDFQQRRIGIRPQPLPDAAHRRVHRRRMVMKRCKDRGRRKAEHASVRSVWQGLRTDAYIAGAWS